MKEETQRAILDRFLRAETMAKVTLRAMKTGVPEEVAAFVERQEAEEEEHQRRFEALTGLKARERECLPKVPTQWHACAVLLLGYEALGYEFANLAIGITSGAVRDLLREILQDELRHVEFYEIALRKILEKGGGQAEDAHALVAALLGRLPKTIDRYLKGTDLGAHREVILEGVRARFQRLGIDGDQRCKKSPPAAVAMPRRM